MRASAWGVGSGDAQVSGGRAHLRGRSMAAAWGGMGLHAAAGQDCGIMTVQMSRPGLASLTGVLYGELRVGNFS